MQISQYSNQNPVGIYLVSVNSLNIFQHFKNFENVNFELILLIVVFIVDFEHVMSTGTVSNQKWTISKCHLVSKC